MILIKEELNHLHAEHADHAEHLDHAGKQNIWSCYKFLSKTAKVIEIKSEISAKLWSRLNYDDFLNSQKWFAKVSKLVPSSLLFLLQNFSNILSWFDRLNFLNIIKRFDKPNFSKILIWFDRPSVPVGPIEAEARHHHQHLKNFMYNLNIAEIHNNMNPLFI